MKNSNGASSCDKGMGKYNFVRDIGLSYKRLSPDYNLEIKIYF